MRLVLELRPRTLRCAYCHDDGGQLRQCSGCGTHVHPECWELDRSCPSLGCQAELRGGRRRVLRGARVALELLQITAGAVMVGLLALASIALAMLALVGCVQGQLVSWAAPSLLGFGVSAGSARAISIWLGIRPWPALYAWFPGPSSSR